MIPKVKSVKALENYKLELEFEDSIRIFDMTPYLEKPIFQKLKDTVQFNKVRVAFNTIEWENGADFDPESLYKLSKEKVLENV